MTSASTANANLWVYLCKDTEFYGVVGLAYVGSLCYSKSYSCGVNEKRGNLVSTAEVSINATKKFLFRNLYPICN